MDSFLCPKGEKALKISLIPNAISLNSTRLIRTLSMTPSVSVFTGFFCNSNDNDDYDDVNRALDK